MENKKLDSDLRMDARLTVETETVENQDAPPTGCVKDEEPMETQIVQRPSMPATNSREILLGENVQQPGAMDNNNDKEDDNTEGVRDDDINSFSNKDEPDAPSKTDFFAARLASAVDNADDAQESFVYESNTNSLRNVTTPATLLQKKLGRTRLSSAGPEGHHEPVKRPSALSLNRDAAREAALPGSLRYLRNPSVSAKQSFQTVRKSSVARTEGKRKLRTTVSRIFDAQPLRRYSGIPDHVNLEDYIDGHLENNVPEDKKIRRREKLSNNANEDDNSLFYFNTNDLEARPDISEYEDDDHSISRALEDDEQNSTSRHHHSNDTAIPSDSHAEEYTSLLPRQPQRLISLDDSPHNFQRRKSGIRLRNVIYFFFLMAFLLTVGFVSGFMLATNKELQGLDILVMDNVLASADELLLDLTVTAFNPGVFPVSITDVDIDLFARTAHLNCTEDGKCTLRRDRLHLETAETILLGSVSALEPPLAFQGGFFNREYDVSASTIKLLNPGTQEAKHGKKPDGDTDNDDDEYLANTTEIKKVPGPRNDDGPAKDDSDKWKLLIKRNYELIIRGNFKYQVPFFKNDKYVAVQKSAVVRVTPSEE